MLGKLQWLLCSTVVLVAFEANAAPPTCHTHTSGPYCQYVGTVEQAYVNDGGLILLYFDAPMQPGAPDAVGITGVTSTSAAAYLMQNNQEFAKLLYASLLAAQARGATIIVQLRGRYGGYLMIDRIWVRD